MRHAGLVVTRSALPCPQHVWHTNPMSEINEGTKVHYIDHNGIKRSGIYLYRVTDTTAMIQGIGPIRGTSELPIRHLTTTAPLLG